MVWLIWSTPNKKRKVWYGMVPYKSWNCMYGMVNGKDRNLCEESSLLAAIEEATVEGQTVCIVYRDIVTATGVIKYISFFFDKKDHGDQKTRCARCWWHKSD